MEKIIKKLNELCQIQSDINEHLPTLANYASECNHITELGVRSVVSTWALASGNPKVLRSYDLYHPNNSYFGGSTFDEFIDALKETKIDFIFTESDVLKIEIAETDLLFIDTYHAYQQIKAEFELHGNKAKKYIIIHDTITFGEKGENGEVGILPAINEFLEANNHWSIKEHYHNCNGLMVLQRNT